MSGGDLPPRQKMIGMMYLVLTALLALNVSKSILDAFITINRGIETTTITFDQKNGFMYTAFDKAASESPAAKVWADKANEVKVMANGMYDHIKNLKSTLIAETDGIPKEVADTMNMNAVNAKDNYDLPTLIMGIADPSNPIKALGYEEWSGIGLKEKMVGYKKGLLGVFKDKDVIAEIDEKIGFLNTEDIAAGHDGPEPWEVALFLPQASGCSNYHAFQDSIGCTYC